MPYANYVSGYSILFIKWMLLHYFLTQAPGSLIWLYVIIIIIIILLYIIILYYYLYIIITIFFLI